MNGDMNPFSCMLLTHKTFTIRVQYVYNMCTLGNKARSRPKLVIKAFKKPPSLPSSFYPSTSKLLLSNSKIILNRNTTTKDTTTKDTTKDTPQSSSSSSHNPNQSHNPNPSSTSREELYRACESCVVHKFSDELYNSLKNLLTEHVKNISKQLQQKTKYLTTPTNNNTTDDDTHAIHSNPESLLLLLKHVVQTYDDHLDSLASIRSIYLYLDRTYVLHHATHLQIWDLGLQLFREHGEDKTITNLTQQPQPKTLTTTRHLTSRTVLVPDLLTLVTTSVTTQCRLRWSGSAVDSHLLRSASRMLSTLGLYLKFFLPPFLASARAYFNAEASRLTANLNLRAYLDHCTRRLSDAHDAAADHLDDGCTRGPLAALVEDALVRPHVDAMLSQMHLLLDAGGGTTTPEQPAVERGDGGTDHLKVLYAFLSRVDGLEAMKSRLSSYVSARASATISGSDPGQVVPNLLDLRRRVTDAWSASLDSWPPFKAAVKSAFEGACDDSTRLAELLAKFVDQQLRTTKAGEGDVEARLGEAMAVFRYLQNKDVFEVYYKTHLSKRLLHRKSSSMDLERFFIAELKAECGSAYTSKLEGMFKDMELSAEVTSAYEAYARDKHGSDPLPSKMDLWVLTTGYWPSYAPVDATLPPDLCEHQARFEAYFGNKYQGRRVTWQHALGTCLVDFDAPKGRKTLEVSELQALALLAFNGAGEKGLTVGEVGERTGIGEQDLKGIVQSLAFGKADKKTGTTRVLRRLNKDKDRPKGDIRPSDAFAVNVDFAHKMSRVKIPNISQRREEAAAERKKADESVFRDRQHQVDAAVIRIMKSRKTLPHAELVSEVMGQLKFKAENKDVKGRVESLIEREYLERREGGGGYNYLA